MNGSFDDLYDGDGETEDFNPLDILMPHRLLEKAFFPEPPRPPLPPVNLPTPTGGVSTGNVNTPAGSASIVLPSAVVKQEEFRAITDRLETSLNQITSRLNTVSGDVGTLRGSLAQAETDRRTQMTKLHTDTRNALAKAKKEQSSQQMTNLMMTMMMQNQIQDDINNHTHSIVSHTHGPMGATVPPQLTASAAVTSASDDNSFMMMLPLMMMQDGGFGGDNMMLPLMMMLAFQ